MPPGLAETTSNWDSLPGTAVTYDEPRMARSIAPILLAVALSLGCDDKKDAAATAAATPSAAASAAATPSAVPPVAATSSTAEAPRAAPDSIAAQHVLVAWKGAKNAAKSVTRSKTDAKKRAEEVATKAKAGADFSALVAEYTDDEATKERRGSLGKFTKDKMTPAFADAAFALDVDRSSEPVETPFGYHVIKRNQ